MRALTWRPASALAAVLLLAAGCTPSSSSNDLTPAGANHGVHLQSANMAEPLACASCHSATGFAVDFSQNPALQAAGAHFDPATKTCSNVACHGAFTLGRVSGTFASPRWSDTAPLSCASCHAMPPSGHPSVPSSGAPSCGGCHPTSVDPLGAIIPGGAHMNAKADVAAAGCTDCHGDPARVGLLPGTDVNLVSAPPRATTGAPATVSGAHLGHVNPASATALSAPIACSECHVVPGDFAHANASTPRDQRVVFGPLSRTGGAAPTYASASLGCAATYCHGNFNLGGVTGSGAAVTWTDTTALTCTSCHGMPPTGHPTYAASPTAASCFQCHPESVNADGTIKRGGGHLNGKTDGGGGCTSCHGDPPTTGKHTISDHRNLRCDKCHPTGYTSTTVVSATHNDGTVNMGSQAGYMCAGTPSLVGCTTGQTRTCTNSCHGRETW